MLKQENTENRSSVFGRLILCISSLKLSFNLNLLLRQIWKSQASPEMENQTFVLIPIHIHFCTFIIQISDTFITYCIRTMEEDPILNFCPNFQH